MPRSGLRSRLLLVSAVVAALALPTSARAQGGGVSAWLFGGYTTKSEVDGTGSIIPGTIHVKDAPTIGVALGIVSFLG